MGSVPEACDHQPAFAIEHPHAVIEHGASFSNANRLCDVMSGISVPRLLAGGLLAGLLFNIGGISSAFLIDVESAFGRVGWEPHPAVGLLDMGMRFALESSVCLFTPECVLVSDRV